MKRMDHANIVKVYELYIDDYNGKIYLILELMRGKELYDVIHKLGHYSENTAK